MAGKPSSGCSNSSFGSAMIAATAGRTQYQSKPNAANPSTEPPNNSDNHCTMVHGSCARQLAGSHRAGGAGLPGRQRQYWVLGSRVCSITVPRSPLLAGKRSLKRSRSTHGRGSSASTSVSAGSCTPGTATSVGQVSCCSQYDSASSRRNIMSMFARCISIMLSPSRCMRHNWTGLSHGTNR